MILFQLEIKDLEVRSPSAKGGAFCVLPVGAFIFQLFFFMFLIKFSLCDFVWIVPFSRYKRVKVIIIDKHPSQSDNNR